MLRVGYLHAPVGHRAKRDSVQCQPCEIICGVNLVRRTKPECGARDVAAVRREHQKKQVTGLTSAI